MVDAGANEGFFSKKIKKTFPGIKILAIEGNNDMKPKLDKIVHEYGNDGSIIVKIALLGNSSGSSVIYYNNPNAHTGSMIYMYFTIASSLPSSSSSPLVRGIIMIFVNCQCEK